MDTLFRKSDRLLADWSVGYLKCFEYKKDEKNIFTN